ncbi:hypothetical protein ACFV1W_09430 [Kitasatospora sp. NPDC059648]
MPTHVSLLHRTDDVACGSQDTTQPLGRLRPGTSGRDEMDRITVGST